MVKQLEALPVDRNSRPLQDAVISNCGELIRQVKGIFFINFAKNKNFIILFPVKKVKKKKRSVQSGESSDSDEEEKSKKKDKKKKKSKKKASSEE